MKEEWITSLQNVNNATNCHVPLTFNSDVKTLRTQLSLLLYHRTFPDVWWGEFQTVLEWVTASSLVHLTQVLTRKYVSTL